MNPIIIALTQVERNIAFVSAHVKEEDPEKVNAKRELSKAAHWCKEAHYTLKGEYPEEVIVNADDVKTSFEKTTPYVKRKAVIVTNLEELAEEVWSLPNRLGACYQQTEFALRQAYACVEGTKHSLQIQTPVN